MPTNALSVDQLKFKANDVWNGLDEVRLYNGTDALYCKEGVTTGLLMQDNQIKVVPVTWNSGVPAVGTVKGYISSDGNYHLWDASLNNGAGGDSTSLSTLRDSVNQKLDLSGGTMTGHILVKQTEIDRDGTNPSSTKWATSNIVHADKDGETLSVFGVRQDSSGTINTRIAAFNEKTDNTTVENNFYIGIAKDGTQTYEISNPTNFRSAINAQVAGSYAASSHSHSYLSTSGGTITQGSVHLKSTVIDRDGSNPSSQQVGPAIVFDDKDGDRTGVLRVDRETNGSIAIKLCPFVKTTSGTEGSNWCSIIVDKSGVATYSVTNQGNFRSAIGAAASSDRRLKSNIIPLGQDAVDFTMALKPCSYIINGENQVGLIAQDVHKADTWNTRMAFETQEGIDGLDDWEKMEDGSPTWKLDYIRIIPPLVATVQQQQKKIEELENKLKNN